MERKAARLFFEHLASRAYTDPGPPVFKATTFNVALHAGSNRDESRTYSVRVTPTPWTNPDDWQVVFALAGEMEVAAIITNNGVELS